MAQRPRTRHTILGLAFAGLGLALFAYTLSRAGVAAAFEGVARVGVGGFAAILLLSATRLVLRSLAWMQCVEDGARLPFREAFRGTLVGEALSATTPLANILGEPAKALFVSRSIALRPALSAIVVENIFYSASVATSIALGGALFLVVFEPRETLRWASYASIGAVLVLVAVAFVALRAGLHPATSAIGWLHERKVAPPWLVRHHGSVRAFEAGIHGFRANNPRRVLPLILLETAFHLAAFTETYVTLRLVGGLAAPTFLAAVVLDSAGRTVNLIFRFIPMRLGVDEAGAGLIANALRLGTVAGVALALVRKARMLVWTGIGVALLLHRGLSPRGFLAEAQAIARETSAR